MRNVFSGMLIGIACILPGASGGVLAVAFGLYRPMLDALMNLFKAPGRHLRFLTPLAAGILAGVAIGAVCLSGAMARYERLMLFLFAGLILGGIPDLLREAQQREPFRLRWLLAMAAGVVIALPLCAVGTDGAKTTVLSSAQCFATGILEGVGTVIPGISTSLILIRLGWYPAYLEAIASPVFSQWVLIIPGFVLSALVCVALVQRLFERCPGYAYYGVLGFLMVSLALVFPGFTQGVLFWAEAAMLIVGVIVVRWMGKLKQTQEVMK